jgi:hypothetical protein
MLAVSTSVFLAGGGMAHADVIAVSATGPASADYVAVSGTGTATSTSGTPSPLLVGDGVAVSGTNTANSDFLAVSGTGTASGLDAVSGTGNAYSYPDRGWAISGAGDAYGAGVAVSGIGDAYGSPNPGSTAISGTGSAYGSSFAQGCTANADAYPYSFSTCDYLQARLVSTYGLAGFPSCSIANPGATYTDQFGNRWLCDEVYSDSILYVWTLDRIDPEFSPPPGVSWNGKKVYLSPSSNNPGPSGCDGYIEDEGARDTAMRTKDVLIARGYKVMVGQGSHIHNKNSSNSWVADVPANSRIHIPIASNGGDLEGLATPCYDDPGRGAGTRVIWESTDGKRLSQEILNRLGPMSPGTPDNLCDNPSPCTGNRDLTELSGTTAVSSYVEMAYHTYRPDMVWLRDQRSAIATTLGDAIDAYFP